MPSYPIPPWIGGGPNPAQVLLEGFRTGSQIAMEQQRLSQSAQESAMRIQLAQQENERQRQIEQQRLELQKAYHQQQIDLQAQRLQQYEAMNQQKLEAAKQRYAADQALKARQLTISQQRADTEQYKAKGQYEKYAAKPYRLGDFIFQNGRVIGQAPKPPEPKVSIETDQGRISGIPLSQVDEVRSKFKSKEPTVTFTTDRITGKIIPTVRGVPLSQAGSMATGDKKKDEPLKILKVEQVNE